MARDRFGCQRCDSYSADRLVLRFTELHVRLCIECSNDYEKLWVSLPEAKVIEEDEAVIRSIEIAATGQRETYAEVKKIRDEMDASAARLRPQIMAWLDAPIRRDEAQGVAK